MSEEVARLWKELEEHRKKLVGNAGAENKYAETYQKLVNLGAAAQLRRKYR